MTTKTRAPKVHSKAKGRKHRPGWVPDLPDHRDHLYSVPVHVDLMRLPKKVDLRDTGFLPPVYDQASLGSCTGNAIAAAIEFDRKKQGLEDWCPSRLFIYYNERAMENAIASDSGAQIRDGIKSVNSQGACKEDTWPYDPPSFATKPSPQAFAEGEQHEAVAYKAIPQSLVQIKACLLEGFPIVFGFTVYSFFEGDEIASTGQLGLPMPNETPQGGHAVLMVGYDDETQCVLVRNSWGSDWGQGGYFTMPYSYVLNGDLADDLWSIRCVK